MDTSTPEPGFRGKFRGPGYRGVFPWGLFWAPFHKTLVPFLVFGTPFQKLWCLSWLFGGPSPQNSGAFLMPFIGFSGAPGVFLGVGLELFRALRDPLGSSVVLS